MLFYAYGEVKRVVLLFVACNFGVKTVYSLRIKFAEHANKLKGR